MMQVGLRQLRHSGSADFHECRPGRIVWLPVHKEATALEAVSVTHTGNQCGFVKTEVIGFEDLAGAGSTASTKSTGKARIQGKDYIMRDVDVVESCFNT